MRCDKNSAFTKLSIFRSEPRNLIISNSVSKAPREFATYADYISNPNADHTKQASVSWLTISLAKTLRTMNDMRYCGHDQDFEDREHSSVFLLVKNTKGKPAS